MNVSALNKVTIDHVIVRRAGWNKKRWRGISVAENNEKVAWTQTYSRVTDAAAAAATIADGAPIRFKD